MLADLGRLLILGGILLAACGGLLLLAARVPGLGHLPGDMVFKRGNVTLYVPLMTCLLLSLLASVVMRLLRRW